jgi:hypothetical protein
MAELEPGEGLGKNTIIYNSVSLFVNPGSELDHEISEAARIAARNSSGDNVAVIAGEKNVKFLQRGPVTVRVVRDRIEHLFVADATDWIDF